MSDWFDAIARGVIVGVWFFVVFWLVMGSFIGCVRQPTPPRKVRSRRVQQLAVDYDLPKKHVARALEVFDVFPLLETQRLRQAAEEDQLSTLAWHSLYAEFIEKATQKRTTTKTEAEMV